MSERPAKTGGGRKMLAKLGVIVGLAAVAAVALQIAIRINGPAVLNTVDRIAGGSRETVRSEQILYGPEPGQQLFVLNQQMEDDDSLLPVIVFIHGGSWRDGDPDDYDFIGRSLAPEGFVVVNLGYRLGESGRWPAMLEDSAAGLQWVRENITDFGGDPGRLVLMGHSAGAYNAAMIALVPSLAGEERISPSPIRGFVGLAGPYDFYPFDSDSTRAAFGDAPDPERTQPVNHTDGEAASMLLIHGLEDTTVKPRNSRALKKAQEDSGGVVSLIEYDGMDHSDPLVSLAAPWRNSRDIHARIVEFSRQVTSSVPVQAKTR